MKIWLVGSGYWGSKIAAALSRMDVDSEIIDIRNGQTIDDIDTLDPVILATPLWQHYEQACQLIDKGHDLYIEKPAAESTSEVIDLQRRTAPGQVVMVGHIFMFNPLLHKLKDIMASGQLGDIKFVQSERHNLGIYQTKTTPILSLAPHDFSIMHYLLGDLEINDALRYDINDDPYPSRVLVKGTGWDIDVSWFAMDRRRRVTVYGSEGQAVWDEDLKSLRVYHHRIENGRLIKDDDLRASYLYDKDCLELELAHFVECIQQRKTPITDLEQALTIARYVDRTHSLLDISI